jgi:hypothetical protein
MGADGSYRISQTQVAEAAGLSRRNAFDFLRSNALKSLLGEAKTSTIFEREEIEIESKPSSQGQSWFLSVPPEIASAYWLWQVHRGNKAALALCMAPIAESLERRFGQALGVTHTRERNEILSQRVQPLERNIRDGLTMKPESSETTTSQIERETPLTLGEFRGVRVNKANCARQKLTKVRLSQMFGEKRSGLYIFFGRRRLKILMQLDYKLALSPQVRESRKYNEKLCFY